MTYKMHSKNFQSPPEAVIFLCEIVDTDGGREEGRSDQRDQERTAALG